MTEIETYKNRTIYLRDGLYYISNGLRHENLETLKKNLDALLDISIEKQYIRKPYINHGNSGGSKPNDSVRNNPMYNKRYNRDTSHTFLDESILNGLCPTCAGGVGVNIVGRRCFCNNCNELIGSLIK